MGFWGSVWSGITSVAKSVGKLLTEKATEFLRVGIETFNLIVKVVENVAKALGIIKPEDDSENLGDRAMRADKKIEDFDSTRDYIEYLRNEIKAKSKEEIERLSPEERLARRALGTSILSKSIEEEFDIKIPVEFWAKVAKVGLSGVEIENILKKFKDVGIEPEKFVKYLKRELKIEDEDKLEDTLLKAYMKLEPNISQKELEEKILSMQRRAN
jgi:acyl carrier protein